MRKITIPLFMILLLKANIIQAKPIINFKLIDSNENIKESLLVKYYNTNQFADAAYNSIMTLNSLIKKENYRNRVAAFNNPTNSDLGFNLNNEIQLALKPLIDKASSNSATKLTGTINTLVNNQPSVLSNIKSFITNNNIFNTITSIVGSWTMQEKKITTNDFDSFLINIKKYFAQYQKLNKVNMQLDNGLDKLDNNVTDLQQKLKQMMNDIFIALHPKSDKVLTENKSLEEMLLLFSNKQFADSINVSNTNNQNEKATQISFIELHIKTNANSFFPNDAIKTAKEISNDINKIYTDYQKMYNENYSSMISILSESKALSKNINVQQIDNTASDLLSLYNESKKADALNLRLHTLNERLKILVACENMK